jgi:predicted GNAT superfamily acetyltransferase
MSPITEKAAIVIREVDCRSGMRAVEELQKEVWGVPDLDVVPLSQLVAAKAAGGVLLGAYDGDALVGFIYGFPSFEEGQLAHHSHMLAVKDAYRNFNLGQKLKMAQRERVLAQGIKLITWTFDPLQSLNAYFNFQKLGVIADRYLINFYGEDASSFLHRNGTDRLWVKWLLDSDRVKARLEKSTAPVAQPEVPPLIRIDEACSPRRNTLAEGLVNDCASIEIPEDINVVEQQSKGQAHDWREATRWAFTEAINAGYIVADFLRQKRDKQTFGIYQLIRLGAISAFCVALW